MIGYVFYTDGGCRPNPGFGGNGIHGYVWNSEVAAKGIGHSSFAATTHGYIAKGYADEFINKLFKGSETHDGDIDKLFSEGKFNHKVTVTKYIDGFCTMAFGATNNTAELVAARLTLEQYKRQIFEVGASVVTLRIDSMYVVRNMTDSIHKWMNNGWVTDLGEPVKNCEEWQALASVLREYEQQKITVQAIHVDGHAGELGNDSADWSATTGVFKSRKNPQEHVPELHESPADGYWAPASENRHPFLSHRFAYFSTEEDAKPQGTYYTGNQGKVVDELGKKVSDGGYALVKLAQVDPHIKLIEDTQCALDREIDYLSMIDIDAVYGPSMRYLNLYGADYLRPASQKKQDLLANDNTLLTKMLHPPYLADRVIDNMGILGEVLEAYERGDDFVTVTDITNTFYDITIKAVKDLKKKQEELPRDEIECKLKSDIAVGYGIHKVDVNFRTKDGTVGTADLRLTMGIDLLDRNSLRKLEDSTPKVSVVTWKAGDDVFQYATIIKSGEDIGIWASVNSNIRVVTPKA